MSDGNRTNKFDDLDEFWELDAMLPPKATPPPRPADVETVDVSLGSKDSPNTLERYTPQAVRRSTQTEQTVQKDERKYRPITATYASGGSAKIDYTAWLQRRKDGNGNVTAAKGNDETTVYVPENPLIFAVRIIRRSDFDNIEERSFTDMKAMADVMLEFTENVEFTALYPQYSRMTEEQKRCYLGFRTEVLNGRYPAVSEPYILFFLYELINLQEKYPPKEAVKLICTLMREYKNCSDSLFAYMCDWLADLCLINRMDAPMKLLEPIRDRVYRCATWKEFFVPFRADISVPDASVLLVTASEYDFRKSKFYSTETADYFEKHIPLAIAAAMQNTTLSDTCFVGIDKDVTTLSHEAFRCAFKSAKNRYSVSIDCACFTRSPLLRFAITSLVKYAENFVREMLGIRSRLSVSNMRTEKKDAIKQYFDQFIKRESERPPLKRGRKKKIPETPVAPPVPEYEKYYDPPSSGFSTELAAKIENDSWRTTDMLLTAFADTTEEPSATAPKTNPILDKEEPKTAFDTVNLPKTEISKSEPTPKTSEVIPTSPNSYQNVEIEGIKLLLRGKSLEFGEFARKNGLLPDTLAEQINQLALDTYGDIAVESDGTIGGFTVIEDYREDLEEITQTH